MYKNIFENEHFLVIKKNHGISFHNSVDGDGLCTLIKEKEKRDDLFTVHRLDKITSGLLLFAKTREAARELSELFQTGKIEKYYIGISNKKPKKRQGLISGDMTKARRGAWKLLKSKENPAKTQFFSKPYGEGLRLFLLKPLTGKTHQLRVALKSISAPVLGDPLYYRSESKGYDRGYLHSYVLRFTFQDTPYCFVNIPEEGILFQDEMFRAVLENFKEPWLLKWPGKSKKK